MAKRKRMSLAYATRTGWAKLDWPIRAEEAESNAAAEAVMAEAFAKILDIRSALRRETTTPTGIVRCGKP
ncbi:hypothetical protein [Gemmatimonas sp.]